MSTADGAIPRQLVPATSWRCYYRPAILILVGVALLTAFWILSRYPSLFSKYDHIDKILPSMAYSSEVMPVVATAPAWEQILATTANWLNSMKIGMGFGVLLGALLHTTLQYYPLKLGANLHLNAVKGALVGVPAGVCANCSVPVACGVTRGAGRVEAALGFLFSSPNFNPVVVVMTFTALPLSIALAKYGVLFAIIILIVPWLVRWAERSQTPSLADQASCAIDLSRDRCEKGFLQILGDLSRVYVKHLWHLLRPTVVIMLTASLISSTVLILVPWSEWLADRSIGMIMLVSLLATAMPVPIALDVMFAGNLAKQGISSGYVAMFAMTLGTYSLIPSIYLWREVSQRLSVALFFVFWLIGCVFALVF